MQEVSLMITTFCRPDSLRKCVQSIRKFYPDIEIIVSDNGKPDSVLNSELVKVYKCRYLGLPFDCGNSHAKNAALDIISNKYAVILDDDFEFTEYTNLEKFKTILDKDSSIGVVGGKPITKTGRVGTVGSRILINKEKEMFWRFPIENPEWKEVEGIKYYYADYTRQFLMIRNSPDIRWDDDMVVGAGHVLFFINLKCHTSWKVAYVPEIEVVHCRASRKDKEYMYYRRRKNWKRKFYEKTGLRYGIFHGHTIYDYKNAEKIKPPDFEKFEIFKPEE